MSSFAIGMINNSGFGLMQNTSALMNLTKSAGSMDMKGLQAKEKMLTTDKLQNELEYSAYEIIEESEEKIQKENIKRSFSTFED